MDNFEKLAELVKNENKVEEVFTGSVEEIQGNLKKYDIDFSLEEVEQICDTAVKMSETGMNGDLSEDALDSVTGGVAFATLCAVALFSWGVVNLCSVAKIVLKSKR